MEMPLVNNGNMKHFHKAFLSYFPRLLMFKEKYGHLCIPGGDPKKEWPGLQQWLKNIRATMSKYDYSGSGDLQLNQCTMICWFPWVLLFMFRLNLY